MDGLGVEVLLLLLLGERTTVDGEAGRLDVMAPPPLLFVMMGVEGRGGCCWVEEEAAAAANALIFVIVAMRFTGPGLLLALNLLGGGGGGNDADERAAVGEGLFGRGLVGGGGIFREFAENGELLPPLLFTKGREYDTCFC